MYIIITPIIALYNTAMSSVVFIKNGDIYSDFYTCYFTQPLRVYLMLGLFKNCYFHCGVYSQTSVDTLLKKYGVSYVIISLTVLGMHLPTSIAL